VKQVAESPVVSSNWAHVDEAQPSDVCSLVIFCACYYCLLALSGQMKRQFCYWNLEYVFIRQNSNGQRMSCPRDLPWRCALSTQTKCCVRLWKNF